MARWKIQERESKETVEERAGVLLGSLAMFSGFDACRAIRKSSLNAPIVHVKFIDLESSSVKHAVSSGTLLAIASLECAHHQEQ